MSHNVEEMPASTTMDSKDDTVQGTPAKGGKLSEPKRSSQLGASLNGEQDDVRGRKSESPPPKSASEQARLSKGKESTTKQAKAHCEGKVLEDTMSVTASPEKPALQKKGALPVTETVMDPTCSTAIFANTSKPTAFSATPYCEDLDPEYEALYDCVVIHAIRPEDLKGFFLDQGVKRGIRLVDKFWGLLKGEVEATLLVRPNYYDLSPSQERIARTLLHCGVLQASELTGTKIDHGKELGVVLRHPDKQPDSGTAEAREINQVLNLSPAGTDPTLNREPTRVQKAPIVEESKQHGKKKKKEKKDEFKKTKEKALAEEWADEPRPIKKRRISVDSAQEILNDSEESDPAKNDRKHKGKEARECESSSEEESEQQEVEGDHESVSSVVLDKSSSRNVKEGQLGLKQKVKEKTEQKAHMKIDRKPKPSVKKFVLPPWRADDDRYEFFNDSLIAQFKSHARNSQRTESFRKDAKGYNLSNFVTLLHELRDVDQVEDYVRTVPDGVVVRLFERMKPVLAGILARM
jgi:hypothetical protein